MSGLTDTQKTSLLFKQANGVAETKTTLDFYEESILGRQIVIGDQIWNESGSIPATAPGGTDGQTTGVVRRYIDRTMSAVPGTTNSFYLAELKDSIPFNFDPTNAASYNYVIKSSTDAPIAFGNGNWIVNNAAGTLSFYGTVPPNMPPKISFYRYVGAKGAANQAALDTKLNLSGGTMTGTLAMGSNKITTSYVPLNGQDVVNKTALDNAITGISWKVPVDAFNLLGNLGVSAINLLTPAKGDQYVLTGAGTLTAGSLAVLAGDLVEFDGTAWFILSAGVGGFPAAGTRAILAGYSGTVGAPYTNSTDQDKIVQFAGDSLTGVFTTDTADGNSLTVQDPNHASFFDNASYVYEGVVPAGHWTQFNGAGQISAGVGITKSGNTLSVLLGAGIAELPSGEVGVDNYTDGGLFTTVNGTDASTATGAKQKVKVDGTIIGVDSTGVHIINASITGAKIASSTITYAKLDLTDGDIPQAKVNGLVTALSGKEPTITGGSSSQYWRGDKSFQTLDTAAVAENVNYKYFTDARAKGAAVADTITNDVTDVAPSQNAVYDALALKVNLSERNISLTNDNAGSITIRQFVYVKSNGAVDLAKADAVGTCSSKIGIVYDATIAAAAPGNITLQGGVFISGFSGLTPGGKVWLSTGTAGGYTQTIPSAVGQSVVELGEAVTASIIEFNPKGAILIAS